MRRGFAWRKFGKTIAITSVIFLVSGGSAWAINALFTIRSVEVSGNGITVVVDQTKLPKNLLFFPTATVTQQILKDNPLVGSLLIKRRYPGTLVIAAVPRLPFAVAGYAPETYALDAHGVVLAQYPDPSDLPTILIALPPLTAGDTIAEPRVVAALTFLRETRSLITVSQVRSFDTSSLVAQAEGMRIRFAQNGDVPTLARTLQTLLSGFRIKGTLPNTIDLRFDKPVVTY